MCWHMHPLSRSRSLQIRLELQLEYPQQKVSITTCVIGNVDTESAKTLMKVMTSLLNHC